jgi:transposase
MARRVPMREVSGGGGMRGSDGRAGALFSYVDLEARIPAGHPLRTIRVIVNEALGELSAVLAKLYAPMGRPSIPPEQLLRALLLQTFYSIRSERQLMERLDFDLLFRWFVGLGIDDPVWDHSTFSKNRDRLLEGDVAAEFLATLLDRPQVRQLLSSEHFSVDGTMIQAWASLKSFRAKDGSGERPTSGKNGTRNFRGERRTNETHTSTTDPDALLYRKGPGMEARLCFLGHVLMENRNGLLVDAELTRASGHAERLAALAMLDRLPTTGQATLGADKGFDAESFVLELRERRVTPHLAQNTSGRRSAIDGRTTRHAGYVASQQVRKRIEEAFGWIKTTAGQARTRLRGIQRVRWSFTLTAAAYNLIRLPKLLGGAA